jgi:hypothetical protein
LSMPLLKQTSGWMELVGEDKTKYDQLGKIIDQIETLQRQIIDNAQIIDRGQVELGV